MSSFPVAPVYSKPIEKDQTTGQETFAPVWLQWFLDVARYFTLIGSGGTSIDHNTLSNLQGGSASQFYHLTSAQTAAVAGIVSSVATWLATPTSANLAAALTDETGTGAAVFATSPTLVTPILGTPTSGVISNCTFAASTVAGLPAANANTDRLRIVTDASTTLALGLGTTVAGGGANRVGVRSDGTNWLYSF